MQLNIVGGEGRILLRRDSTHRREEPAGCERLCDLVPAHVVEQHMVACAAGGELFESSAKSLQELLVHCMEISVAMDILERLREVRMESALGEFIFLFPRIVNLVR